MLTWFTVCFLQIFSWNPLGQQVFVAVMVLVLVHRWKQQKDLRKQYYTFPALHQERGTMITWLLLM